MRAPQRDARYHLVSLHFSLFLSSSVTCIFRGGSGAGARIKVVSFSPGGGFTRYTLRPSATAAMAGETSPGFIRVRVIAGTKEVRMLTRRLVLEHRRREERKGGGREERERKRERERERNVENGSGERREAAGTDRRLRRGSEWRQR